MTTQKNHPNGYIYLAILLGLLTAFAPFVTDFYLPALPSLTDYFSASASAVQMSLTMSMLGLACGQLFVGPISDKFGRKSFQCRRKLRRQQRPQSANAYRGTCDNRSPKSSRQRQATS